MKGQKFLKVTSILMIIGGVIGVIAGIIAILGMTARDSYLGVILSIAIAFAVSFGLNCVLLKVFGKDEDMEAAKHKVASSKSASKGQAVPAAAPVLIQADVKLPKLAFACDAGMGSSAMGAAGLTKKLNAAGADCTVPHYAINDLPYDMEAVVTQASLVDRVRTKCPNAKIYPVNNFMGGAEYDAIVSDLLASASNTDEAKPSKAPGALEKIVFACDAGMGSSAMGAAALAKKLKAAGLNILVTHCAINDLASDTAFVVTHESLADRARQQCPNATIRPITNFMGGSEYDAIVEEIAG